MKALLAVIIFFIPLCMSARNDGVTAVQGNPIRSFSDSAAAVASDTEMTYAPTYSTFYNSTITSGDKPEWFDIEQQRKGRNDTWVFFVLLQLLILLTILKLSFHADYESIFRVVGNANVTSQIGRAAKDDITLSSVLMSTIFITTMSVLTRFFILHFYPHSVLQNNFSIVILIFLFTFFSLAKYTSLKYIGYIFEITPVIDEYLFNLSAITRTIGISMIPILFVLYTSPEKYFNSILVVTLIFLCSGLAMIVIRGLSTSYKLMYSSMYHFLIYICVGEILPVFLFIKLLTKTVI